MELNQYFDHTLLKPEATTKDIDNLIDEGLENHFFSLCVQPNFVSYVKSRVGEKIKIATVIGFPLGANVTETKVFEAKKAIEDGADELDMVLQIGALKEQNYEVVYKDIEAVKEVATNHIVKVILETCLLTDDEIIQACALCEKAGADFVKTSTGFSSSGASVHAVSLMRKHFAHGVKASGGIRTLKDVQDMIKAGATRIGASASVAIMGELNNE